MNTAAARPNVSLGRVGVTGKESKLLNAAEHLKLMVLILSGLLACDVFWGFLITFGPADLFQPQTTLVLMSVVWGVNALAGSITTLFILMLLAHAAGVVVQIATTLRKAEMENQKLRLHNTLSENRKLA